MVDLTPVQCAGWVDTLKPGGVLLIETLMQGMLAVNVHLIRFRRILSILTTYHY
jgi:hypothetical protein